MSWIECLLKETDEAETPRSYITWAGLASISAVAAPNVYINRGGVYKLSPNLFVMLIGESGLGKGLPVAIAKKLVGLVGTTRVISGRNTIQAIIRDLATTSADPKTGVPKFKDSRGFIVSGEFATLLQEDKAALPVLTEMYDTHYMEDWKNSTKTSGVDTLKDINVTLFGGSTPEHFSNVVPETDVKGGFVGRILTVYEEERYKINPLSDTEAVNEIPFNLLSTHLKKISEVKGDFKFTSDGRKFWEEWYTDIRSRKVHDPTGAVNRLPDNVLKVAMCLSLSKGTELILRKSDLEESADKCMTLTIDTKRIVGGKGKSALGEQTQLVLKILWRAENHIITRQKILSQNYGSFDAFDLDRIMHTLTTAGLAETIGEGGETIIQLLPSAVKHIKQLMER